jgi:hypothetical protein
MWNYVYYNNQPTIVWQKQPAKLSIYIYLPICQSDVKLWIIHKAIKTLQRDQLTTWIRYRRGFDWNSVFLRRLTSIHFLVQVHFYETHVKSCMYCIILLHLLYMFYFENQPNKI